MTILDNETLRRVQDHLLIIAEEIKRVCEENDIHYFLAGGTLIGVVRHSGFIPWDDDLDIGMLREDYDRFIQIAPEKLSNQFFLQTWKTDNQYCQAFAKVRMKQTVYREANDPEKKDYQGFFVDVFPYDNIPDDIRARKKFSKTIMAYRYTMQMKGKLRPWKTAKGKAKCRIFCSRFPFMILSLFLRRNRIIESYTKAMNKHNNNESLCVCQESGGARFGKYPIDRKYLQAYTMLSFEGIQFSCPSNFDGFLRDIYGDYMKLPPIEQQKCTHGIVEIVFKEDIQ